MIYKPTKKVAQIFSDAFDFPSRKPPERVVPSLSPNKHDDRRTIDNGPEQNTNKIRETVT